ncbi:MAG: preprotein translocase subunit YajC [Sphingobacteriales bacterium JAD_PAG50586_3]|nr:MAG: preprotein translocase subunit YajC [Sphingobacteriales bacterium JAD_PAG50586_3]
MTTLLSIFLMAQQADGQGGNPMSFVLMIVMMVGVFYFFMIRPQTKKAKEAKTFREGVKKGDKIITIGGVHGKIVEVNDVTAIIETEGGGKLKIDVTAISPEATLALNKGN